MEIRSLEIDFKENILKVNNRPITDRPIIVDLPGPDGYELKMLCNPELATGNPGECDIIKVTYEKNTNSKL